MLERGTERAGGPCRRAAEPPRAPPQGLLTAAGFVRTQAKKQILKGISQNPLLSGLTKQQTESLVGGFLGVECKARAQWTSRRIQPAQRQEPGPPGRSPCRPPRLLRREIW